MYTFIFCCGILLITTILILLHEKFLKSDWLRPVVFQLNLKYLHVKITSLLRVVVLTNNSMICSDIWHKYHSWYFSIVSNFTRLAAREITYNSFEISLVVFMPNITTNHAITYTNIDPYNLMLPVKTLPVCVPNSADWTEKSRKNLSSHKMTTILCTSFETE